EGSVDVDFEFADGAASVVRDDVSVVAGFTPEAVHPAVAAAGNGLAARTAAGLVVGRQVAPVVALLDAGLRHPVAAERSKAPASRLAAAVAAVVDAVVAELPAVDDPVPATGHA